MTTEKDKASVRQKEIVAQYLHELDKHLTDLKNGMADKTFEIKDLAELLFVSPKHLSNTIQEGLGKSPCDIDDCLLYTSRCVYATGRYSAKCW